MPLKNNKMNKVGSEFLVSAELLVNLMLRSEALLSHLFRLFYYNIP